MTPAQLAALMAGDFESLFDLYAHRPAWHAEAGCRGMGPELFFPERREQSEEARTVCASCPVRTECTEHALEHEGHGIWGGLSANQRRDIRQTRKRETS